MEHYINTHTHVCTHTQTHTPKCACFSSSVLGLCSLGAMATEYQGEKNLRRLAELHPPGSRAKTHESHDKNNIPHLSDIVLEEFLLNRGISQRAYLIVLKPSGVTCECEFFSTSKHGKKTTFVKTLVSTVCLWFNACKHRVCVCFDYAVNTTKLSNSGVLGPMFKEIYLVIRVRFTKKCPKF